MSAGGDDAFLPQSETETAGHLFDNWFDPVEFGLGGRAREFLQAMLEAELDEVLARSRYARRAKPSMNSRSGWDTDLRLDHFQISRRLVNKCRFVNQCEIDAKPWP